MTGKPRTRLSPVVLLVAPILWSFLTVASARAQEAEVTGSSKGKAALASPSGDSSSGRGGARRHYAGRSLPEALRLLSEDGLSLIYSSDLVRPEMKVATEPRAVSVQGVLEELLAPHGLAPEIGPKGRILVVRRETTPVVVRFIEPVPDQVVAGPFEVEVEVDAAEPIEEITISVDGRERAVLLHEPYIVSIRPEPPVGALLVTARARGAWGGVGESWVTTRPYEVADLMVVALKQLFVTVTVDGEPLLGLREEDFVLWDDRRRQQLVTFGGGDLPLSAAVLLDLSMSMEGSRSDAALAGARAFFSRLGPEDRAMLLSFSDETLAITPFRPRGEGLAQEVRPQTREGATALIDHLYAGLRLLDAEEGRRVVVLLSDGEDVSSVLDMEQVLWKVERTDALIYWIRVTPRDEGFMSAWRSVEENRRESRLLERAVRMSGGRLVELEGLDEVPEAFDRIVDELKSQYVLGYYPELAHDGRWRAVRVGVDHARASVRLREGYVDD